MFDGYRVGIGQGIDEGLDVFVFTHIAGSQQVELCRRQLAAGIVIARDGFWVRGYDPPEKR